MLTSLALHRIGVIDEAVLEFGPGFTALTGETGAGKTMVITGLSLLMGRRLDSRRAGLSSMVSGRMQAHERTALAARLDDIGAEVEDGEVLIVRKVTKDGRSRAHIGGVPVPVSTLAEVIASDITIHGQSDQQRLKENTAQREVLDSVLDADANTTLEEHRRAWATRTQLIREHADLTARLADRDARRLELQGILEAIEAVDTFDGEDDELRSEIEQLATAQHETHALEHALMALAGDEEQSALTMIDRSLHALANAPEKAPNGAGDDTPTLHDRLAHLRDEASDIARDLSVRRDNSGASPARLEQAQQRLHELSTLIREYGPRLGGAHTITELLQQSSRALHALHELEGASERLSELEQTLRDLNERLHDSAAVISSARRAAAQNLAESVEQELSALEMPTAALRITVEPATLGPHGHDSVSFELRPHAGADYMPLATGASGGELSRVMLALEVAIASLGSLTEHGKHPVFIFDEIDAGIGGKAARAVGQRLATLATKAQVIVVTHLPQVAAYAQTHLHILKEVGEDGITRSTVVPLDGEQRASELARMLAGDEQSATALEHARELLDTAGVHSTTTAGVSS